MERVINHPGSPPTTTVSAGSDCNADRVHQAGGLLGPRAAVRYRGGVTTPELAVTVSQAGGLGMLQRNDSRSPDPALVQVLGK